MREVNRRFDGVGRHLGHALRRESRERLPQARRADDRSARRARASWLAPLPVESLWGAGPKTAQRLRARGLCNDRAGREGGRAMRWRERSAPSVGGSTSIANAVDPREVVGHRRARSIGSERTLAVDVSSRSRAAACTCARRRRRCAPFARPRRSSRAASASSSSAQTSRSSRGRIGSRTPTDVSAVLFAKAEELLVEHSMTGDRFGSWASPRSSSRGDPQRRSSACCRARDRAIGSLETTIDALAEQVRRRRRAAGRGARTAIAASASPTNLDFLRRGRRLGLRRPGCCRDAARELLELGPALDGALEVAARASASSARRSCTSGCGR